MANGYYRITSYTPTGARQVDYIVTDYYDEVYSFAEECCYENAYKNKPIDADDAYFEGCDCYIENIDYQTFREEVGY